MGGVFSLRAVYDGYRACRRRKRGTANAQRYELRLLDHLVDTAQALQDRDYAPSRSLCFVARQPKAREIHAADFSDRVVHHVLVPRLEALFEPVFIHDLYSNRKGKGTHAAVERLGAFMRSVSDNGKRPAWFLQLDVRNFFNRIDQALLFRLVNRRLKKAVDGGIINAADARDLSWLTRVLLKQDLKHETRYRCTLQELDRVPPYKRLTEAPPGKGLPIGNLTSQFFANVYLNELDQFVKHGLKCRHYLRYVDDVVLVHERPEQLRDWERRIETFPAERPWLGLLFDRVEGVLRPRWQPLSVTSLRSQVAYFRHAFEPALVLVQLGNRVALFEPDLPQALEAAPWLGRWSQTRAENRNGLSEGRSWPLSHLKGFGKSLRRAGQPYCFIAEEGLLPGGMKRRVLRYLFVGPDAPLIPGPAGAAGTSSSIP